jgi:hypothetical protein
MVKNIPYLKDLKDYIIQEIIYLLKPQRYEAGTLIVQRGDEVDQIFLLKAGCIVVEVPQLQQANSEEVENAYFDWLNEGSCFCTFTSFNQDMFQLVTFKALTTCTVETIDVKALRELEKRHIQLRDILKVMEIEILNGEKSDLDFFRFKPPLQQTFDDKIKKIFRSKFRKTITMFVKQIQSGEKKQLLALEALKQFQDERKKQMVKLNELKFSSVVEKETILQPKYEREVKEGEQEDAD